MGPMEVASRTLREVEFRQQLRGYNQEDVDEFLERVAAGVEVLQERLARAEARAEEAERRAATGAGAPGGDDDSIRRTLVLAQRAADMAVKEAEDKAASILAQAESRARQMLAEAEGRARRDAQNAERELNEQIARMNKAREELMEQLSELRRHFEDERRRARAGFAAAIAWLDTNLPGPGGPPGAPGAHPERRATPEGAQSRNAPGRSDASADRAGDGAGGQGADAPLQRSAPGLAEPRASGADPSSRPVQARLQ